MSNTAPTRLGLAAHACCGPACLHSASPPLPQDLTPFSSPTHPCCCSPQDSYRFGVFQANLARIIQSLQDPSVRYISGLTKFAAMTFAEVQATVGSGLPRALGGGAAPAATTAPQAAVTNVGLPDAVDWRATGQVTPVKEQGMVGAALRPPGEPTGHKMSVTKLTLVFTQPLAESLASPRSRAAHIHTHTPAGWLLFAAVWVMLGLLRSGRRRVCCAAPAGHHLRRLPHRPVRAARGACFARCARCTRGMLGWGALPHL